MIDPAWASALWIIFLAKRDDLLELETRRRIYEQVRDFPGLHLSEIARQTGTDTNHAKYHLRFLEKGDMVSARPDGNQIRFYVRSEGAVTADAVGADEKRVLAHLRRPKPLEIVLHLLDQGALSASELADVTGNRRTSLIHHLGRMEADGLLIRDKDGRTVRYDLAQPELIHRCLLEFRPPDALVAGFLDAWDQITI